MRRALCLAILVLSVGYGSPVRGQIDRRVQPGQPQPGHALDSNAQVGSGGFNLDRPGLGYINSANAIATGNVTGLGAFHSDTFGLGESRFGGLSGLGIGTMVQDPSQFRANLPSAGISDFQRRSFGLVDLRQQPPSATPFGAQPYYGPTESVVNIGGIQRGQNQPGTSTPLTPFTRLTDPNAPGAAAPGLPTGVPDPQDRRVVAPNSLDQPAPGFVQRPLNPAMNATEPAGYQRPYLNAVDSPIFGPSAGEGPRTTPNVAERSYEARVGGPPRPAAERMEPAPPVQSPTVLPAGIPLAPPPEVASGGSPAEGAGQTPGNLGSDRFADLYGAARTARSVEPGYAELVERPAGAARPTAPEAPGASEATAAGVNEQRQPDFKLRLSRAAAWAEDLLSRPVQTFVGTGNNALNGYLRAAEEAMHAGDFYRAAGQYGLASMIDPENPLPMLGRGHALAAAGDYVSAVHYIVQGIVRFPEITVFRLDLTTLLGRPDVFDLRRADLEKQLIRDESHEMRFLVGYLEYYSGMADIGLQNIERAAKEAPKDSIIARFPELLSGKLGSSASEHGDRPASPKIGGRAFERK